MAKSETADATAKTWTMDELRAIVALGMPITEARLLLEDGYSPADVRELAELQAEQRRTANSETQQATAKAMQKAMRPENEFHPGISSLSYPEGDQIRPRPALPFELWWNGYPMHMFPETEHYRELELAAQITPGEYTVLRKDFTTLAISVTAQRDADQKITRLDVKFSDTREEKGLTPPKIVTLYQMVHSHEKPRKAYVAAMGEYLTHCLGAEALA